MRVDNWQHSLLILIVHRLVVLTVRGNLQVLMEMSVHNMRLRRPWAFYPMNFVSHEIALDDLLLMFVALIN